MLIFKNLKVKLEVTRPNYMVYPITNE